MSHAQKFDPDPARTEAFTIARALRASNKIEEHGIVVAMRAGHDGGGRFSAQRAEMALAEFYYRHGRQRGRGVNMSRRRGVALCLVEDRIHVLFPLTPLGRAVAAAIIELDRTPA